MSMFKSMSFFRMLFLAGAVVCGSALFQASNVCAAERVIVVEGHPHLNTSIEELREARKELKEAPHDFGGHREAAIRAVDAAIEQLELAKKFANKR